MQSADEIVKLAALRDGGLITEDDFASWKAFALSPAAPAAGVADELRRLIDLRRKGTISGQELAIAEKRLRGRAARPFGVEGATSIAVGDGKKPGHPLERRAAGVWSCWFS